MNGKRGVHGSITSPTECCSTCENDPACWGFVYDEEESLCYLKDKRSHLISETRDTLTAGIVQSRETLLEGGDRVQSVFTSSTSSMTKSSSTTSSSNWESYVDDKSGDTYYYNTVTKETTWDRPANFVESSSSQSQNEEVEFDDVSLLSSSSEPLRKRTFENVKTNELWTFIRSSSSSTSRADIIMEDVYDNLPVGDPDGGPWKQGWRVTYDHSKAKSETLYVHVVPHSHNDPGWIKTYDEYYHTETKKILDSVVSTVSQKPNRRFIWAETSYFSRWWQDSSNSQRQTAKRLIDNGQLEIVTGGWVMNDEANPDIPAIVGQMMEGHKWLQENLNVRPRYGWAIDPFGHTSTMAYVLKKMNFDAMLIQRVYVFENLTHIVIYVTHIVRYVTHIRIYITHIVIRKHRYYAVKKKFARERNLEFYWRQPWDESGSTDMLCHMMPFFSYDVPHTCGPDPSICCQFDFKRRSCPWRKSPVAINNGNVKQRAELILDQWRKKASMYRTCLTLIMNLHLHRYRLHTYHSHSITHSQSKEYKHLHFFA